MTKTQVKCTPKGFNYLDIWSLEFIWDLEFGYWNFFRICHFSLFWNRRELKRIMSPPKIINATI
jgi:hypothetical protein